MKKILIIGLIAAGLIIGGTSFVGASMNDSNEEKVEDTDRVEEPADVQAKSGLHSLDEVKEIALSEYEGQILEIELEHDDGIAYYEVEMENGEAEYELYIKADTGEIMARDLDDDRVRNKLEDIMSVDEAEKIAIELVGGEVKEIELDEDDNRYEYELELRTDQGEVELTLDAVSGEVLEQELEG